MEATVEMESDYQLANSDRQPGSRPGSHGWRELSFVPPYVLPHERQVAHDIFFDSLARY